MHDQLDLHCVSVCLCLFRVYFRVRAPSRPMPNCPQSYLFKLSKTVVWRSGKVPGKFYLVKIQTQIETSESELTTKELNLF